MPKVGDITQGKRGPGSDFEVDYIGDIVNKIDDPQWVVFPWEEWWNLPTF